MKTINIAVLFASLVLFVGCGQNTVSPSVVMADTVYVTDTVTIKDTVYSIKDGVQPPRIVSISNDGDSISITFETVPEAIGYRLYQSDSLAIGYRGVSEYRMFGGAYSWCARFKYTKEAAAKYYRLRSVSLKDNSEGQFSSAIRLDGGL